MECFECSLCLSAHVNCVVLCRSGPPLSTFHFVHTCCIFTSHKLGRGGREACVAGAARESMVYLLWTAFQPEGLPAHTRLHCLGVPLVLLNPSSPCCRIPIIPHIHTRQKKVAEEVTIV